MTSHAPRDEPGEFEVADLVRAGLLRRSTVRCSQAIEMPFNDLIRRIGELAPADAAKLADGIREAGIARDA